MSIHTHLDQQVQAGRLGIWKPATPGIEFTRTLLFTQEIYDAFQPDSWKDYEKPYRFGLLRADFDHFTSGGEITIAMDPYDKDQAAFFARVDPVALGVVDIRSRSPKPAVRVFGAFVEADCFVAMKAVFRTELGVGNNWDRLREDAIAIWGRDFEGFERLIGDNVNDYVTSAVTAV